MKDLTEREERRRRERRLLIRSRRVCGEEEEEEQEEEEEGGDGVVVVGFIWVNLGGAPMVMVMVEDVNTCESKEEIWLLWGKEGVVVTL